MRSSTTNSTSASYRATNKTVRHLPLSVFLADANVTGYRQPDPVPSALVFAAVLFSLSAFLLLN